MSKQRFTKKYRKELFDNLTGAQKAYIFTIDAHNPDFHEVFAFRLFYQEGFSYTKFSKETGVTVHLLRRWSQQTYEKITRMH